MWNAFKQISDEAIIAFRDQTANACVSVMDMPTDERNKIRGPGKVSANEAGALSAMFATAFSTEAEKRGI